MSVGLQVDQVPWTFTPLFAPLLVVSALLSALLWAIHWLQQSSRFYKMGNKIPGPPTVPFVGNALIALGKSPNQLVELALELSKQFNSSVIRGWMGYKLIVFIFDPADVEIILSSHVHIDKSTEYRFFKPWLGNGLLISTGDKWRAHRKLIAPAFHLNILKGFMDVFNSNSQAVVKRLQLEMGKTFDVHDHMSTVTVDILLETAMGISRTTQDNDGFDYAMAVMKMCDIIHQRQYKIWLRFDAIFNMLNIAKQQKKLLDIIHGLTKKVIKRKNEEYAASKKEEDFSLLNKIADHNDGSNGQVSDYMKTDYGPKHGTLLKDDLDEIDENDVGEKRRLAFLDLLIESAQHGADISDREIKEQVDTIMFEGHDTTAAGSSFVLCLLGIHQNVQDRVYQELQDIFGDSDRPVTFADTLEMKYLERVILETLRMYPPVPIIARKLNEDVKLVSGDYVLPAGTTVVVGTLKMHRMPHLFPNPLVFDPDNFLPERCQERHYYSYVPFSAGPRSCVGRKYAMLKLKVLLSTMLRNFRILSDLTEKDFRLQADIILKRADGFRIQIEPRNKTAPF